MEKDRKITEKRISREFWKDVNPGKLSATKQQSLLFAPKGETCKIMNPSILMSSALEISTGQRPILEGTGQKQGYSVKSFEYQNLNYDPLSC